MRKIKKVPLQTQLDPQDRADFVLLHKGMASEVLRNFVKKEVAKARKKGELPPIKSIN